jgi:hypothetical protein
MHALLGEGRPLIKLWEDWQAQQDEQPSNPLLIPQIPNDLAAHYDLTISHPAADSIAFNSFDRWLAQAAAARGLNCALLRDGLVEEAVRRLEQGRLSIGFHLDYFALWHVADNPYAQLAQAVHDHGGRSVNPPARARLFTDKAVSHVELLDRGLGVPETVLIRPWAADRALTPVEKELLRLNEPGSKVYIKPANGFSGRGVVRVDNADANDIAAALASARNYDRRDTYLVQREVTVPLLRDGEGAERPAYWRILYCLGEWIPCWWTKYDAVRGLPSYRRLTRAEIAANRLQPVLAYAMELAELTGMQWFSTELCLSKGPQASKYRVGDYPVVAIDYVNDQCDVDVQTRWPGAPPDALVRHVAERFADAARATANNPEVATARLAA